MIHHCHTICALLLLSMVLAACDSRNPDSYVSHQNAAAEQAVAPGPTERGNSPVAEMNNKDVIELDWDNLVPSDWQLDDLMEEYDADNLSDEDPRAAELMDKIKAFWKEAPVVEKYDGKTVKLPGFVVPLETDAKTIDEFLLVPYYGACIHVPPPPANQTVHVVVNGGRAYQGQLFDTVWVTGTLKVEKLSNELGDAGYRIDAMAVEPYE